MLDHLDYPIPTPALWGRTFDTNTPSPVDQHEKIEEFEEFCNMILFNPGSHVSPELVATAKEMKNHMDTMKQKGVSKLELYNYAKASFPSLQNENAKLLEASSQIEKNRINRQETRASRIDKISKAKLPEEKKFHFTSKEPLKRCIYDHTLLQGFDPDVKGDVAELAADRFADTQKVKSGIEIETHLVVIDLVNGQDSFTGKPLPRLAEKLDQRRWPMLEIHTEAAVEDCAMKKEKTFHYLDKIKHP